MLRNTIDRYGLAALVAITAAGYVGGIRPVLAEQTKTLLAERSVAAKEERLRELSEQRASLQLRVESLEGTIQGFRQAFSASPHANERIGELADLAQVIGVAIESIRPGQPITSDGFRALPIAISGSGEPEVVARFLSRIRERFPDMGTRSLSVSAQAPDESSLSVELVWFTGRADSDGSAGDGGD